MSDGARSALTMTVLLLIVLVGGLLGWRAMSSPLPGLGDDAEPKALGCERGLSKGEIVHADDVTVSVYNAGSRSGLAGQTLQQLLSRGFLAGDVGNAPGKLGAIRLVRVLAPRRDDPAARLVAWQFGRRTPVQVSRGDLGPGIEVVVGDRFIGLVDAPRQLKADAAGSGC